MTHMLAYLGGDSDVLASRRADTTDVRLVVDFPDEQRMLVVMVMQTGEVVMSWTADQGAGRLDDMYLVGNITTIGNTDRHTFDINPTPTRIPVRNGLKLVPLQPRP